MLSHGSNFHAPSTPPVHLFDPEEEEEATREEPVLPGQSRRNPMTLELILFPSPLSVRSSQ
jgi:hypothetical protein